MTTIYSEKKEVVKYDGEFYRAGTRQLVKVELRHWKDANATDYVLESEVYVDGEAMFTSRRGFSGYKDRNAMLRLAIAEYDRLLADHPYFSLGEAQDA